VPLARGGSPGRSPGTCAVRLEAITFTLRQAQPPRCPIPPGIASAEAASVPPTAHPVDLAGTTTAGRPSFDGLLSS